MSSKLAQCFLGWMKGQQRFEGPVDDAAVQKAITGADGQAKFAYESYKYDREISAKTPFTPNESLLHQFYAYTGVDARELTAFFRDPSAILGEDTIAGVHQIYLDHIETLRQMGLDPMSMRRQFDETVKKLPPKYQIKRNLDAAEAYFKGKKDALNNLVGVADKEDFLRQVAPALEGLGKAQAVWEEFSKPKIDQIEALLRDTSDPIYGSYLADYFKFQSAGGQLYANKGGSSVLNVLVRNAVGNLVSWNPMIATMNVFEYVPKATSYALMNGQSPAVVIKAMSNLMKKSNGNPFSHVAEWHDRGIYGTIQPGSKFNYLEKSEALLRNLSASLGEVMGQAPELAVEKVAFANRFGNEMQPYWTSAGAESVALMRFAFASNKMYLNFFGQMALGLHQGDMGKAGKAAAALAAFSVATAIQTGGISALPAPVAYVLKQTDPDMYDSIKELDQEAPYLNLAKNLGLDIAEKTQPLGGFAVGVGYSVAQQDVQGGLQSLGKIPMDLKEGEFGLAGARMVLGMLGVGQVGRIPGVNHTTKRISSAIVNRLQEDSELNMELMPDIKESLGFGKQ